MYLLLRVYGEEHDVGINNSFDVSEICENLQAFYEVIYPLVDMKLEMDFGRNSPNLYLYGAGTVVFSPYMVIDRCKANKKKRTAVINILVTDILIIQFDKRPWVVIEDCEVQIYVSRTSTTNTNKVIKILSISVPKFRRASANCEQYLIKPEEVKFILNSALANSSLVGRIFHVSNENSPEFAVTYLLENVFKYYMSRLMLDSAVNFNFDSKPHNKNKIMKISCEQL